MQARTDKDSIQNIIKQLRALQTTFKSDNTSDRKYSEEISVPIELLEKAASSPPLTKAVLVRQASIKVEASSLPAEREASVRSIKKDLSSFKETLLNKMSLSHVAQLSSLLERSDQDLICEKIAKGDYDYDKDKKGYPLFELIRGRNFVIANNILRRLLQGSQQEAYKTEVNAWIRDVNPSSFISQCFHGTKDATTNGKKIRDICCILGFELLRENIRGKKSSEKKYDQEKRDEELQDSISGWRDLFSNLHHLEIVKNDDEELSFIHSKLEEDSNRDEELSSALEKLKSGKSLLLAKKAAAIYKALRKYNQIQKLEALEEAKESAAEKKLTPISAELSETIKEIESIAKLSKSEKVAAADQWEWEILITLVEYKKQELLQKKESLAKHENEMKEAFLNNLNLYRDPRIELSDFLKKQSAIKSLLALLKYESVGSAVKRPIIEFLNHFSDKNTIIETDLHTAALKLKDALCNVSCSPVVYAIFTAGVLALLGIMGLAVLAGVTHGVAAALTPTTVAAVGGGLGIIGLFGGSLLGRRDVCEQQLIDTTNQLCRLAASAKDVIESSARGLT